MVNPSGALVSPKLVFRWHEAMDPGVLHRMYRTREQCALISERLGLGSDFEAHPAMQRFCRGLGVVDQLTLRAVDPTLKGVTLCSPVERSEAPEPKEGALWTRIAAHVTAGYRLRERLRREAGDGAPLDPTAGAEAVLDTGGRILHAEGEARSDTAREAFQSSLEAMDRACGPLRRESPEEALAIWRGLVDGTWSVVQHVDTDGRKLILARRNDPNAVDPQALTARERQTVGYFVAGHSVKEVAYALGLSPASIETYLTSAMAKLRVGSRADLLRLFWSPPGDDDA
jgi:DNA-binding CsgD family transcriptional regulator